MPFPRSTRIRGEEWPGLWYCYDHALEGYNRAVRFLQFSVQAPLHRLASASVRNNASRIADLTDCAQSCRASADRRKQRDFIPVFKNGSRRGRFVVARKDDAQRPTSRSRKNTAE